MLSDGITCVGNEKNEAITLTELLVVISIITIIASVAVVVGGRALVNARMTYCKNNLRQIGTLLNVYSDTYLYLPPTSVNPPGANYDCYDADDSNGVYYLARRFNPDASGNDCPISTNWVWMHGGVSTGNLTTSNLDQLDRSNGLPLGLGWLFWDKIVDYTEHRANPQLKPNASKEYINYVGKLFFCRASTNYASGGVNGSAFFGPYQYDDDSNPNTPSARYVECSYIYRGIDSQRYAKLDYYASAIIVADYNEKRSGAGRGNINLHQGKVNVLYGSGRVDTLEAFSYEVVRQGKTKTIRAFFAEPEDVPTDTNGVFSFTELQLAKNLYLAPTIIRRQRSGMTLILRGYNFEGTEFSNRPPSSAHRVLFEVTGGDWRPATDYTRWTDTEIRCTMASGAGPGDNVRVEIRRRYSNTVTVP